MGKNERRLLEAYVGEHGSGKSEIALSRALWLARDGLEVALADLDIVEPCYTLNLPLTRALQAVPGLTLLTNASERLFPGETGNILAPAVRFATKKHQNVILDVGYGVDGFKVLQLLEGYEEEKAELKIYFVQNFSRPATGSLESALDYLKTYEKLDGIVSNTHLGDKSTLELSIEGEALALELGKLSDLPVIATALWRAIADQALVSQEPISAPQEAEISLEKAFSEIEMNQENISSALRQKFKTPLWLISRLMPSGFWLK